ncbi:hypothetical protein [Stenotrophomonas sp. YIM B06876]|uniref:hypothetical protein n=1 Tax=Stenotrophomonas sp. YIM B06876 TaxID=3060211 RepID=UPI00273874C9|nr:hypothetical protein [Stenotrophomonas sp. YIM B06876]
MSEQEQVGLSVLEYLYRDAGNFKTHGALLLSGYEVGAEAAMLGCLDWGRQFVAEQIGVPSLCEAHWAAVGDGPSDLDHAYHELSCLRPANPNELHSTAHGTLDALLGRMRAAKGRWDVRLSPNCEL